MVAGVVALGGITGCSSSASTARTPRSTDGGQLPKGSDGVVVSVIDGDTIKVRLDGSSTERVRLIGIDTPETKDPRTVVECFGAEASVQTAKLLPPGTKVRLETDVERRDKYSRLLAYVWRTDDALFVNEALVKGGWAGAYRYPPNVKYADRFSSEASAAREAGLGLWGACGGTNTPASTTRSVPGAPSGACDPNYAGACVPVTSSRIRCKDVGVKRFRVVGKDIHRFDGDGDGIACE